MKKIIFWCVAGLGVVVLSGFFYVTRVVDLRTPELKKGITKQIEAKGRSLLMSSLKIMGGWERWKAFRKKMLRVQFKDTWKEGLMTSLFVPAHLSGRQLELVFRPDTESGRLRFLEGKRKGTQWGVQHWLTYTADAKGTLSWKQDDNIKFYIPTYRYFMFMPFYLMDAKLIAYAGQRTLRGKTFDLVFATWGTYAPQKKVDQYLLWIERSTKRVVYAQYTIRDIMPSFIGASKASRFKRVHGFLLPHQWIIFDKIEQEEKWMHKMTYQTFIDAPEIPSSYVFPEPKRMGTK